MTNSNFLTKYQTDQTQSYLLFIEYLSEESALTKKNVAWFIGNDAQHVASFANNAWQLQTLKSDVLPDIKLSTRFKDNRGYVFSLSDNRKDPFVVFYPSGQSSGGEIVFDDAANNFTLKIDKYSSVEILKKKL